MASNPFTIPPFSVIKNVSEESIRASAKRIDDETVRTPVMKSSILNQQAGGRNLFFKCEHLQRSGSFKFRGALSAVTKIIENGSQPSDIRLVTNSSGNFGLGLSLAARSTGIENTTVMMNVQSSVVKKTLIKGQGAKVQPYDGPQERDAILTSIIEETGALFISSGQTLDVISGQGTVGLEFMNQVPKLNAIVAPVGGGGLIAGISTIAKAMNPNIKIIGAEPSLSNACELSVRRGELCRLNPEQMSIADGLRASIGPMSWSIIREHVDDVISVSEDEIKNATLLVWQYLKQCVEPSAAVALAAVLSTKFELVPSELVNVGVILSGGNVSQETMREIMREDMNIHMPCKCTHDVSFIIDS